MPVLEVKDLSYQYPGEEKILFPDFQTQGNTLIYGPSGIGKTTLLHLISGLKKIQDGNVTIENTDLASLDTKSLDNFRAQNLGIVFQSSFFISSLNVIENILIAGSFHAEKRNQRERAEELLSLFGLAGKKDKKINTLSVGEKQRVSIARAFLNHPKLVIADEPSSALDDQNCNEVIGEMFSISKKYGTVFIVVSHDQRLHSFFEHKIALK